MERPNKYERETKIDDDNDDNNERTQLSPRNYLRTSCILSIGLSMGNSDQSVTTDNEEIDQIDFLLTKEAYEAAEDLSFIANQMRSACHYEEVNSLER
jgi:hypothetical protein